MPKFKPSDNAPENLLPNKSTSTSFPKPKKVKCFQCHKSFEIKFVIPQQDYSKKNSWKYWTGQKSKGKICNDCLKKLYYDKPVYWETIKDLRKRNLLRNYIYEGNV